MTTGTTPPPGQGIGPGCLAVEDLLAAHALGGLDPDEAARVVRHVRGCPRCDGQLLSLRGTAAQLGSAVVEVDPPPGLRSRVLAAAALAGRAPAPPAGRPAAPSAAGGAPASRAGWWRRPGSAWGVAAAAGLLAVAAGGWGIAEHARAGPSGGSAAIGGISRLLSGGARVVPLRSAAGRPGSWRAALVARPGSRAAYLVVTGVPAVAAPRVYQLWYIRGTGAGSRPQPIAAMTRAGVYAMPRTPAGFSAVAITLEPQRHDRRPRGPVLLAATLA